MSEIFSNPYIAGPIVNALTEAIKYAIERFIKEKSVQKDEKTEKNYENRLREIFIDLTHYLKTEDNRSKAFEKNADELLYNFVTEYLIFGKSERLEGVFLDKLRSYGEADYSKIKNLFNKISDSIDQAVSMSLSEGFIENIYYQNLRNHGEILRRIDGISGSGEINFDDFISDYIDSLKSEYGRIIAPSLATRTSIPIDSMYVPQSLSLIDAERYDIEELVEEANYNWATLYSRNRVVILGNPGGGKSTLVRKIAYEYAIRYSGDFDYIPIVITLRKHVGDMGIAFEDAIRDELKSLGVIGAESIVSYLIKSGKVAFFIDGIDEILNIHDRGLVIEQIERFSKKNYRNRFFVTSRVVGYGSGCLGDDFSEFIIEEFEQEEVGTYARNWFRFIQSNNFDEKHVEKFLAEAYEYAEDIVSNPLMLGLICTIYTMSNYIPRNRPEVYNKCAEMMYEKWDIHRKISVNIGYDDEVVPMLSYLAHTIYNDSVHDTAKSSVSIERMCFAYYYSKISDNDIAMSKARDFVNFCSGRAWIISEVGINSEGLSLYDFNHRTFLEFFAAKYLTRSSKTVEKLSESIVGKIDNSSWDNVCMLALHIYDRFQESVGDDFYDYCKREILNNPEKNIKDKFLILKFIARASQFLRISNENQIDMMQKLVKFTNSNFKYNEIIDSLADEKNINHNNIFHNLIKLMKDILSSPKYDKKNIRRLKFAIEVLVYLENQIKKSDKSGRNVFLEGELSSYGSKFIEDLQELPSVILVIFSLNGTISFDRLLRLNRFSVFEEIQYEYFHNRSSPLLSLGFEVLISDSIMEVDKREIFENNMSNLIINMPYDLVNKKDHSKAAFISYVDNFIYNNLDQRIRVSNSNESFLVVFYYYAVLQYGKSESLSGSYLEKISNDIINKISGLDIVDIMENLGTDYPRAKYLYSLLNGEHLIAY